MDIRPIKRVIVEFADGSVQQWELPDHAQGFYRERYTWQAKINPRGKLDKWDQRIDCHEIFWTVNHEEVLVSNDQDRRKDPSGNGTEH